MLGGFFGRGVWTIDLVLDGTFPVIANRFSGVSVANYKFTNYEYAVRVSSSYANALESKLLMYTLLQQIHRLQMSRLSC